jgi:hypothetical protein
MAVTGALILLLAIAAPDPQAAAGPRGVVNQQAADSLGGKLADLEQHPDPRRAPVRVTEGEINSYLRITKRTKLPAGLTDPEVRFDREQIEVRGFVDLEQVKGKVQLPSALSPLGLLSGRVPFELRGHFTSKGGFGTVEIQEIRVASWPLPLSVVEQMVATATRNEQHPDGVDLHAPFRLPYSVSRIRLEPGRAWLEFH